ncbi:carboxylesterase 4A [Perognathus longimembris pacificus]|uniref:carboxylesterase 4A n=1 Tax=Perognathus longimembris pacificus TaxID=214514 RepID=UPI002018B6E5|nr:carboxylesterase 4A [Perognathus longimembris pacificus]
MKWILWLSLTLFLTLQAAQGTLHIRKPLLATKYGKLHGKRMHVGRTPIHVFLGIPFAKPPVGARRFAPPEPLEPWKGIRRATTYPPACPQEITGQIVSMYLNSRKHYHWLRFSEDCLYLNVYAPVHKPGDPLLPVMVWFPGGAFLMGAASTYEGSQLAAREKVVVVFLQNRLGILGFLSTGDSHARGNWAMLDQIAALQWVQQNIKAFGGDPDKVTLFGQSAGAMCVSALMMSPLAQGLFHQAISQSGTALINVFITRDPLKVAKKVAHIAGCDHNSTRIMVECLRAVPEGKMRHVSRRMNFFNVNSQKDPQEIIWFPSPVVDGVVLPDDPAALLALGKISPMPYLLGVNNQEFEWVLPYLIKFPLQKHIMRRDALIKVLEKSSTMLDITKEQIPLVMDEYLSDISKEDWKMIRKHVIDLAGDATFMDSTVRTARYHRDAGFPVYLYEFERKAPSRVIVKPLQDGADHADEIYFIFGGPFSKGGATSEEKAFSLQVMKYWANFARTGNPNDGKLPYWPLFDEDEKYLQLDFTMKVGVKLKEKEITFWEKMHLHPERHRNISESGKVGGS